MNLKKLRSYKNSFSQEALTLIIHFLLILILIKIKKQIKVKQVIKTSLVCMLQNKKHLQKFVSA